MNKVKFFLGYPLDFNGICYIYPPSVKEVATTKNFQIYIKVLTYSQEEIEDEYIKNGYDLKNVLTPFEYVLNSAYNSLEFRGFLTKAFMFFIHEPVIYLFEEKKIAIGDLKEVKTVDKLRTLEEKDYFDFQNLIRESIGMAAIEPPNPNEDPRVKAIKAKGRYRDKIKAKQGGGISLKTTLASICCMNLGLNPLNIGELSYAAIQALMSTYQEKEKYELDIDSLLAGADAKKVKPKYWIRNLDN